MVFWKILAEIKGKTNAIAEITRDLNISEKELMKKLKGRKPLYIHEAEAIFTCLGINDGNEKIKFF